MTPGHGWRLAAAVLPIAMMASAGAQTRVETGTQAGGEPVCADRQTPAARSARINGLIAGMTVAERISQLRDRAPAIPRLGLPAYNWWNEGLHGLARDGYATVFPQAIGLAATWDPALLQAVGGVIGMEARAKFNSRAGQDSVRYGGLTVWSPNINIFRDPRWGRGQETYGEDPFLTGLLATRFVNGVQGTAPYYLQADSTPKHFAAHSGPERGRDSFNAVVSAHDLADTYFAAFHTVATSGHAAALMCSYNEINGTPTCGSPALLGAKVRGQWGFRGYIVSDCDAVGDISDYHHFAPDKAHGAADALKAGVDLDCGNTYDSLTDALAQHLVTEAQIDTALHRLLEARMRLGMMDARSCTSYGSTAEDALHSSAHEALAERAAEESAVLLRNSGALPLKATARVAVFGVNADSLKVLEANYHGTAEHPVTPLEGLQARFHQVTFAQGALLGASVPAVVPRTALRVSAEAEAVEGWRAEYFNNDSLSGTPVGHAVVPRIDNDIDRTGFIPAQDAQRFSTRWSGALVPPAAGDYTLRVDVERCWDCTAHDSFVLNVDGKPVLRNDGGKGEPDRVALHFPSTAPHAIELEYRHTGDDEGVVLEWVPPAEALLQQALAMAKQADAIVLFAGLSPDLEGEALQIELPGFDGGDRTTLELPETQRVLMERLRALGKPMTVVLMSGSAVALGPEADGLGAVVEAWYPGQAGGTAVARLLAGDVDFSGRLPVTFYRSVRDLPPLADYSMAHRTYRFFDGAVEYPFGFGLSYVQPVYGAVQLSAGVADPQTVLTASASISNPAARAISTVAELYVEPPAVPGAPRLSLQGVERVTLEAGESREVRFTLTPAQRSVVTPEGRRVLAAGSYRVVIGGQQPATLREGGAMFRVAHTATLEGSR